MPSWTFPIGLSAQIFRRKNWLMVLIWPATALIIVGFLWINTAETITSEKVQAEEVVRRYAVAAANSYAQQLGHTAERIDQITIRLKY